MARTRVNEGSTSYHTITITDASGVPVTPEALRYRVSDGAGTGLVAWTDLPTTATEIEVSAATNTIGADGDRSRYLTIEATHNSGDKITEELAYFLIDLKGV